MAAERSRTPEEIARRHATDAERNERARQERLLSDGARAPSENLAEGLALARAAAEFFGKARADAR